MSSHVQGLAKRLYASERAIVVNLSARVGSIGDNRLGGWYSYRASKAALNQLTKTLRWPTANRPPPRPTPPQPATPRPKAAPNDTCGLFLKFLFGIKDCPLEPLQPLEPPSVTLR